KTRLPSMSVTAVATREVVPDMATLRLSVSAEKPTASAAAEETARSSQGVLAEIRAQGLDPRDIKTAVTVSPVFDDERGPQGMMKRTLRGYVARNALTVRLHDTARAGALARVLIDKGANVFEGIDFAVSEGQRPMDELRIQATKDAMRKAKLYAEAAGVRLGRVLTIDPDPDSAADGQADMPRRIPVEGTVTTVIPVEPGIERLSAKVSMTWEISP
ncbi:SIMPL domain-containing protein, partial [Methylobacterium aerolatum]